MMNAPVEKVTYMAIFSLQNYELEIFWFRPILNGAFITDSSVETSA